MYERLSSLICAATLTVLATSSLSPSRARAELGNRSEERDDPRLYGGLWLGFGGKLDLDASGPFGVFDLETSDDQVTTVGGQLGVDVPLLRYFSIGAEARFGSFNSEGLDDNGVDRSKLVDLDFKPRLNFPLRRTPLELYLTVPVGLTIPILADNFILADFGDGQAVDGDVGWNLGVGAGVNFWLTRRFALNLEPMWLMHWFDLDLPVGSGDVMLKQFTLFINAVVAL